MINGGGTKCITSRIIPGMTVSAGHHDAVRELRPVPRARFLFAGERRQPDILIAGIFSETPQAGIDSLFRIHAGEWGRAGFEGVVGAGRRCLSWPGRKPSVPARGRSRGAWTTGGFTEGGRWGGQWSWGRRVNMGDLPWA